VHVSNDIPGCVTSDSILIPYTFWGRAERSTRESLEAWVGAWVEAFQWLVDTQAVVALACTPLCLRFMHIPDHASLYKILQLPTITHPCKQASQNLAESCFLETTSMITILQSMTTLIARHTSSAQQDTHRPRVAWL
jgi:hypothetical protein